MRNKKKIISHEEFYTQQILKMCQQINWHTVPLFEEKNIPEFIGCGILLCYKERHFVITASHNVLEGNQKKSILTYTAPNVTIRIFDPLFKGTPGSKSDKKDIAIWEVNKNALDRLVDFGYHFFDIESLNVDHKIDYDERYMLVSYPGKQVNTIWKTKQIKATTFSFVTGIHEENKQLLKKK